MEKENYLLKQLETGRNLNITLLSHNSKWHYITKLAHHYKNCRVIVFGGGINYLKESENNPDRNIDNSDLIIYYSSGYREDCEDYEDHEDYESTYLNKLALELSNKNDKRVTACYTYLIKDEDVEADRQIEITSFKDGKSISETRYLERPYDGVFDLTELTLSLHDDYEKKIKKIGRQI